MSTPRLIGYLLASLLAVFAYFYGLDSPHIPKNGDEFPYTHITRLTAASGHWLPLQSELDHMRNTKPPLLFWQGIASTDWGRYWDWWHLRYPSVIYTLLTALLVFLLARRLAQQQTVEGDTSSTETGFSAALIFLSFFSSYRYGRPYLVNPAEVFWLFLPFFSLLYWRASAFDSRLWVPLLIGFATGIGLLYKSFALVAPVGLALSLWYLQQRRFVFKDFVRFDTWKIALALSLALGLFALWFALDPDPAAVWQEFVVGENAGKFHPGSGSYLATLLWGDSSIWALLIGYPMNAGLLFFPVAALFFLAWRRRRLLGDNEQLLWLWLIALFLSFSLPSQRSARYLLEAMPGVAVLCALNWHKLPYWVFRASLLLAAAVLALLGFLAWRLQREAGELYGMSFWTVLGGTALLIVAGMLHAHIGRKLLAIVALLCMLILAAFLSPFDAERGVYGFSTQKLMAGKEVWVPCNFRAVDEGYRFLLPGAQVHGYLVPPTPSVAQLASRYPYFAVHFPIDGACTDCQIIDQRLEIKSRHSAEEIRRMLQGEVFSLLFVRELLLASPVADPSRTPLEGCR